MRNSYIVSIILGISFILSGLTACKNGTDKAMHAGHAQHQLYTCPMHPQVVKDQPGQCPICGMDLVLKDANKELVVDSNIAGLTKPVNEHVIASIPAITAESGTRIYSSEVNGVITYDTRHQTSIASKVGGRVERLLIKYNYQPVRRGQLIMEIYSPDLAAAQRELLFVARNSPEMLSAAKQRLQLLGMQPAQIAQVLQSGNVLYRVPVYSNSDGYILEKSAQSQAVAPSAIAAPAASSGEGMGGMSGGGTTPAATSTAPAASPVLLREGQYVNAGQSLFTIYQASGLVAEFAFTPQVAAKIKKGQKLLFYPVNNKTAMQPGNIGLIEPVFRNGQNFTLARIYLQDSHFQVGELMTANIPVIYTGGFWLPKKAVWQLGNKSVVFKKEHNTYVPVEIVATATTGDMIQVSTDISDWRIAANASYLVDSESFIELNKNVQQ
ncbi:efflux RND transporter periplasmic adaptor subunit [Chitinophaga ginsengisoli]|uniref:Multidrug efflux pump subunit AcrA (Membrane-fusion protein) n=1 Tax=Chitinophaga ginsengisoli TaxID=363837 RepID=A0A2P8FQS5_9BACT|nr:efflux RND transporter periplasmic adaptor subunit [Chitinophaga ginsengisoli]PSL24043.1 multidrug efflux pump subunit AcrA (membrane-fusion protein) [Chitinophaga ginsengisoli]